MLQVIVGPPPLRTQLETGPACAAATRTPLDSRIDSVLKTPLAGEPTNLLPMVIGFPLLLRSVGVPPGSRDQVMLVFRAEEIYSTSTSNLGPLLSRKGRKINLGSEISTGQITSPTL